MSNNIRIKEALDHAEANIAYLATLPDSTLAEKLDTIHLQSVIAEQKNLTPSLELLEIWRAQIIQARIYKAENDIPDSPSEIALAIADIETKIAVAEQRNEAMDALAQPVHQARPAKPQQQENENQLSLF